MYCKLTVCGDQHKWKMILLNLLSTCCLESILLLMISEIQVAMNHAAVLIKSCLGLERFTL